MPASQNFVANLKVAMDAKDVSQAELARRLDIGRVYVNRVLAGKVPNIGMETAEKFAKALEIPLLIMLHTPKEFADTVLTRVG